MAARTTPRLASCLLALALALPAAHAAPTTPAKKTGTSSKAAAPKGTSKATSKASGKKHRASARAQAATATQPRAPAGSAEILMPLPALYTGTLPCADCAGTAYRLTLQPTEGSTIRGEYSLHRQTINSLEQTPVESGPWRLSYDYGRLILGGGTMPTLYAIKDRNTLVQLGIEGKPVDGGQHHLQRVLTSDGLPAVAPGQPTMTSAAPMAPGSAPGTLEATFWKLVQLGNTAITPSSDPQRDPHIVLQPGEQRITGSGGCNRFAGSFERPGADALRLTGIVSTRVACAEADKTMQEALFFDALNQTRSYRLAGKRLELRGESGGVLAVLEMH